MSNDLVRPHALRKEVQARVVQALAEGGLTTACSGAGVTARSFYHWKKLYESGAEHAKAYAESFGACDRAMAIAEQAALRTVRAGAPGWQGAAWSLERRYPKRWGRRSTIAIEGVPVDLSKCSDEGLDEIERRASGRH